MKPDWDSLGKEYADSKTVIIGDVDCTAAGKPLCDKYGVKGYPTIKYFNPPDEEGEDYKGGRDLATLKKFAESELGPGCSVDTLENCSDEQKAELDTYIKMDAKEREEKLESLKTTMKEAQTAHDELLKSLQSQYKTSQENLDKLKEESQGPMKLLKAASPKAPKADAAKDEV